MPFGLDYGMVSAFLQVIMIDLVLAGDNAVVIGMAAAGLDSEVRRKAILIGILAATVLRIGFALIATQLLAIVGLLLAGGLLLLWVCWNMFKELRESDAARAAEAAALQSATSQNGGRVAAGKRKTLRQAVMQIIVADVSMSLDNVLAVAGAAQHHFVALIFGLALSVLLMGAASAGVARLLNSYRWISYLGLLIILFVAVRMIYHGADELPNVSLPTIPFF